jgi:hypothetical protein
MKLSQNVRPRRRAAPRSAAWRKCRYRDARTGAQNAALPATPFKLTSELASPVAAAGPFHRRILVSFA